MNNIGKELDKIGKAICIVVVIFASISLLGVLLSDVDDTSNSVGNSPATATPIPIVTIGDIKNSASPISYDELMRNGDNYIGEVVYKRGEIRQVSERRTDKYVLRVATKWSEYGYYEDVIWIEYKGNRLLEGDIIDVWGESKGLETYDALLGNQITIPRIDSLHVELIRKAGNNK